MSKNKEQLLEENKAQAAEIAALKAQNEALAANAPTEEKKPAKRADCLKDYNVNCSWNVAMVNGSKLDLTTITPERAKALADDEKFPYITNKG